MGMKTLTSILVLAFSLYVGCGGEDHMLPPSTHFPACPEFNGAGLVSCPPNSGGQVVFEFTCSEGYGLVTDQRFNCQYIHKGGAYAHFDKKNPPGNCTTTMGFSAWCIP